MASRWENKEDRLLRETDRLLKESLKDIELMNLTVAEARKNIRNFLERLPQFDNVILRKGHREP